MLYFSAIAESPEQNHCEWSEQKVDFILLPIARTADTQIHVRLIVYNFYSKFFLSLTHFHPSCGIDLSTAS